MFQNYAFVGFYFVDHRRDSAFRVIPKQPVTQTLVILPRDSSIQHGANPLSWQVLAQWYPLSLLEFRNQGDARPSEQPEVWR